MKFVHMADMHFDIPFTVLNNRDGLGEQRRLEQREAFNKIIEFIKENNIEYLFIAGDLYEHEYIRKSTIDYINNLFKEIPNTKIYIAPGNHDPYINDSMYKTINWSSNVRIFNNKVERIEDEECNIYGYGFNDFYCKDSKINEIKIENKNKINILITHGTLNGGTIENMEYNPLKKKELEEIGFDYIAMGHIHKTNYNKQENQRIIYPGSTIALGFDEYGEHGFIFGNLTKENINIKFIPIDKHQFQEINVDISNIYNFEELVEKINELQLEKNIYYKLYLIGNKNFEINIGKILKYINRENVIKIKNNTKIAINLNKISEENNLKGIFVQKLLKEAETKQYDKKLVEDIIELGLNVLEKNK